MDKFPYRISRRILCKGNTEGIFNIKVVLTYYHRFFNKVYLKIMQVITRQLDIKIKFPSEAMNE